MNLRDFDYICAVAELGHFGRAAEACFVSQPTLSSQIKKLEAELGVQIFERSSRGVTVTDVGQDIIAIAQQGRQSAKQIKEVARAAQDPLAGTLSLGMIPTIAPYLIPRIVPRLREQLPKLDIQYQEDITERLNTDLLKGHLDIAVLATPIEDSALAATPLYEEAFRLLMPTSHPLAQYKTLTMDDIDEGDVLLLTEGHCFRDQALSLCKTQRRQQSLRATSLETLINMVASGEGLTLVPQLSIRQTWLTELNLIAVPLDDKGASRRISLTYRKGFPRMALVKALSRYIQGGVEESLEDNLGDSLSDNTV